MKELIQTRNVLREKFKSVKLGKDETEKTLEKTFKPITLPLNKFLHGIEKEKDDIKTEKEDRFYSPSKEDLT